MSDRCQPRDATALLGRIREGDEVAFGDLVELMYTELRAIAGAKMKGERPDHTLQPTALVHEGIARVFAADRKLVESATNRTEFLRAASWAMKKVLIEHARARRSDKRGGGRSRTPLDETLAWFEDQQLDLLDLDEALSALKEFDTRKHDAVLLRYFGGCTNSEVAEQLKISEGSVERDLRIALAWLRGRIAEKPTPKDENP